MWLLLVVEYFYNISTFTKVSEFFPHCCTNLMYRWIWYNVQIVHWQVLHQLTEKKYIFFFPKIHSSHIFFYVDDDDDEIPPDQGW